MSDSSPIIVADANISNIEQALAGHGAEVRIYHDADPDELRDMLRDAEILLCRSTIKVNADLLEGTPVRFVATATSGTDHFDTDWLDTRGIRHESAAGSNARSVAEYVFNALFTLEERKGKRFRGKTLGIIGVGHVGSQVQAIAEGLSMNIILCDPPLRDETGDEKYRPMMEVIQQADIITLHVPLTDEGPYPTQGLIDAGVMNRMRQGAVLINAARGGVVIERDLNYAIANGWFGAVVLDVFEHEPMVNRGTVIAADIATPHIAGHAYDGKLLGTQMVYDSLCDFMEWERTWDYTSVLKPAEEISIDYEIGGREQKILYSLLHRVYNIGIDQEALLAIIQERDRTQGRSFRRYRTGYRTRRQCAAYTVRIPDATTGFARDLRALGFNVIGK